MRKTDSSIDVWDEILSSLREKVTPYAYKNWFEDSTTLLSCRKGRIEIGVPNNTYRNVLKNKFEHIIKNVCSDVCGPVKKVSITVVDHLNSRLEQVRERSITEIIEEQTRNLNPGRKKRQLDPAFIRKVKKVTEGDLVKGSFNKIAVSAAEHVIQFDKDSPNPLFLYGDSGMGKTFLLQYMYNEARKSCGDGRNVVFTSSENFMNDFITSLKNGMIGRFRSFYRGADLLLIDDIHFLADGNKESTKEECFHTFNELLDKGKQVVITCDKHPNNLKILGSKLMQRLMGGMWVQLNRPDTENRLNILKRAASECPLRVPGDVLSFIAEHYNSDIRGMIGAFTTAVKYCTYAGEGVSLSLVKEALGYTDEIQDASKRILITPQDILNETASYFGVEKGQILSDSRNRNIVNARHVSIYLCNRYIPDVSLGDLAVFYRSSRPAILYAGNKVTRELKQNHRVIQPAVSEISRSIESSY